MEAPGPTGGGPFADSVTMSETFKKGHGRVVWGAILCQWAIS